MVHRWFYTMDESGETPMSRAQKSGVRALAEVLLRQDEREPPAFGGPDGPELSQAAYWGLSKAAEMLLDEGVTPADGDSGGEFPLHDAARNGHIDTVKTLVEHGSDVNAADGDGLTSMHWVAMNGRRELAEFLIDHGGDVNARGESTGGLTPRAIALLMGYDEMVSLLGEHGGVC
jgi:ankyrin repeat protein